MARYIDANEAIITARKSKAIARANADIVDFQQVIDDTPTADVVEVVHGEWSHLGGDEWCCTNCGEVIHTEGSWEKPEKKFCHECGAKMDGKKVE